MGDVSDDVKLILLERERILLELNSQNPGYDPDDVEPPPPPPPELSDDESSLSSAYPSPPPPFTDSFPSPSCSPAAPSCLMDSPASPEPSTSFESVLKDPTFLQGVSSSPASPEAPRRSPLKQEAQESFDSPAAKRPRMGGCSGETQFSEESSVVNYRKSTQNDDNVVSDGEADVSNKANNSQAQSTSV
ncbi:hypothetical protein L596_000628 [Steinernema carpocapsae]|uniref:Uncharacterized protein n=1 Tax=Steinernema carpocapsae TaxID=34508 RepID=A0A4U8UL29_STECR|nr:hypothetical protein L596_000628 [Steinernema carpocapsae]